jgi:hypothetical protein
MGWATTTDVLDMTGVTVTAAQVLQAQTLIELFSGVDESYKISGRDVRHLRMAVAYQAAWMKGQIDVTTRTDVSTVTQDEMSFTYANTDAPVVAPLARAALKRLSWKTSRSVMVQRLIDTATTLDPTTAFLTDEDCSGYRPLDMDGS